VFIDLEEHRDWVERVCKRAGIEAVHHLWKMKREKVLDNFMDLGFKDVIVAVNEKNWIQIFWGES